jgi:putative ABC transport system permease protein
MNWVFRDKHRLDGLDSEIREHIELETAENIERGMTPRDARRAALRKFGNPVRVQEDVRAVWTLVWLEQLIQDVRYGARMLRRSPGFAAVIIGTLALGIGMNTAVFSVVNAVLFRPLPYPDAERTIWLGDYSTMDRRDYHVGRPDYLIWKDQAHSFDRMAAYGNQDLAFVSGTEASEERIASIDGDFWVMTAAQAAIGRLCRPRESNAMVLSWALFERRFHSDPHVLGRTATLNGYPFTVVGVLAKEFRFVLPQQFAKGDETRDIDAYIPITDALMALPASTHAVEWEAAQVQFGPSPWGLFVMARLKEGVPIQQAHAEMQTLYDRSAQRRPSFQRNNIILDFRTLRDRLAGEARRALLVLSVAAAFVLLISCANIANLLVARAVERRKEVAIRAAMGAGRIRVLRQFLAESALLAAIGGAGGLALGQWGLTIIKRLGPQAIRGLPETTIDAHVLWFTLLVSLATGFLFGMGPVLSMWKTDVQEALKADTGTSSAGGSRIRLRGALVAMELALAIVLLAGAGLMFKSFWRMYERPPGFRPENILVFRITLSGPQYGSWPPKQAYTEELLRRLESMPGVEAAGIDSGALHGSVNVQGAQSAAPIEGVPASIRGMSPGYLRALGVPLISGELPPKGSLDGVVVNEAFARQMPGIDLQERYVKGSILSDRILGVVANFKAWQLDAEALPEVYMPYQRLPVNRSMRVFVRTSGPAAALASSVREVVSGVDRSQPIYEFQTLEQALSDSIAPRRFNLFLLGSFATTALLLALIGIYGVIAYSVSQRTREIGIRLALGAKRAEIVGMVVRHGMMFAMAGILTGVGAALGLTRLMDSLLYNVKPNDPLTFLAVSVTLTAVALLASLVPALRAASVDPLKALRYE